jgi:bifunctional UDP-N-acetylglucosamine pyrophosphorylase/glucosamine-1-phosphate N-acetyltransferase
MPVQILIMAAGLGTRMKSRRAKVLHTLAGRPLISYIVRSALELRPGRLIVVIGHQAGEVRAAVEREMERVTKSLPVGSDWSPRVEFVLQSEQRGTGHAVMVAREVIRELEGCLVILYGDMPMVRSQTIADLVEAHSGGRSIATAVTVELDDPTGYGRIIRSADGSLVCVVEEKDATDEQRAIKEINSGLYCFEIKPLVGILDRLTRDNKQGEYYLTDALGALTAVGYRVGTYPAANVSELLGVNTRVELARLEAHVRRETCERLMLGGVTILDPHSTYIDGDVVIGQDTIIHPQVVIEGESRIGADCEIHSWTRISDSVIADRVVVRNGSVINNSRVGSDVAIGPFAHLRTEADVADEAAIGNFVEVKKSKIGRKTKAMHLAYLGDAQIGERVNIGAGTITCNYDGKRKNPTTIEDDVKIGSDTMLVAPVRVGAGSVTGAGSVVVKDVPEKTLVVGVPAVEKKKVKD